MWHISTKRIFSIKFIQVCQLSMYVSNGARISNTADSLTHVSLFRISYRFLFFSRHFMILFICWFWIWVFWIQFFHIFLSNSQYLKMCVPFPLCTIVNWLSLLMVYQRSDRRTERENTPCWCRCWCCCLLFRYDYFFLLCYFKLAEYGHHLASFIINGIKRQ